jgi:hypothetical protein
LLIAAFALALDAGWVIEAVVTGPTGEVVRGKSDNHASMGTYEDDEDASEDDI